jgi:hypothetical protein
MRPALQAHDRIAFSQRKQKKMEYRNLGKRLNARRDGEYLLHFHEDQDGFALIRT